MIFKRKRKLPAELRPELATDERVLAWARVTERTAVVATNFGLFLPGRDHRLGWHEIHKAGWDGRELAVIPAEQAQERDGYQVMVDGPRLSTSLAEPGEVPHVVRSRVTRSVSLTSHHPVPGGGVRVVGRRVPGQDGLTWAVRYDDGTDPDAPDVIEATAEAVAGQRAATVDATL